MEKHGVGLNLTYEVRDGIRNHQTSGNTCTLEGKIVRISDKIAYIHHDCDDAIRAGILTEDQFPKEVCDVIGYTTRKRLDSFIHDVITNSLGKNNIEMSKEVEQAMKDLRAFMFERVYVNPEAKSEEGKAILLVQRLYEYYCEHIDELPVELIARAKEGKDPMEVVVCDYIASMTDRYAMALYEDLFIPKSWQI